ncbi:MAG TPA: STAS domain-containing protein [Candidatus Omnitrophota bacterium]|nr:STAS domain-containing protein [Candidatus Omnitrophota bacterium]
MKIQTANRDDIHILELSGELDYHSSPELREKLNELTGKQTSKILIDLRGVDYMDSSGIATFVEAFQKTKRYQGRLILAELTTTVRGVFEIAKLDSIFEITKTMDEAFEHFTSKV